MTENPEMIRKDVADAMVAAVIKKIAHYVCNNPEEPPTPYDDWGDMRADTAERHADNEVAYDNWLTRQEIERMTPADAQSALDRLVAEAVAAERERCAKINDPTSQHIPGPKTG